MIEHPVCAFHTGPSRPYPRELLVRRRSHRRGGAESERDFEDNPGFARVAATDEVLATDDNLSIPLYMRQPNGTNGKVTSLADAIREWRRSSQTLRESMTGLFEALDRHEKEKAK
jgi:hypothetical protein